MGVAVKEAAKNSSSALTAAAVGGVGFVALVVYASGSDAPMRVLGCALLIALAAAAAGAMTGFLFGIPRSRSEPESISVKTPGQPLRYLGNTNLEQISDWLTKILVGVTLTQLSTIRSLGGQLFSSMAPALGGAPDSTVVAGAITVYFAILGFIVGWLTTRLSLGAALSAADKATQRAFELLDQADRSEARGDDEKAFQLRQSAADLLSAAAPGAQAYEEIRRTTVAGSARTHELEQIMNSARRTAAAKIVPLTPETVSQLFNQGGEGQRVMALGFMEGRPETFSFDIVSDALLRSRSAFEQFHALKAIEIYLTVAPIDPDEAHRLAELLKELTRRDNPSLGADRRLLSERLIRQLEE